MNSIKSSFGAVFRFQSNSFINPLKQCTPLYSQMRFASKKSGGSTQNGRTSNPKYLGFKKLQGAKVIEGNIILRQRGRQWHPGTDVGIGKDHTLFALNKGRVVIHYDLARNRRFVSVDDGTLEPLPSRIEMKRKLRDMINVEEYLNLDAEGRYEYTMKQLKLLTSQMEKDRIAYKDSKLVEKERRVLGMVDMTML